MQQTAATTKMPELAGLIALALIGCGDAQRSVDVDASLSVPRPMPSFSEDDEVISLFPAPVAAHSGSRLAVPRLNDDVSAASPPPDESTNDGDNDDESTQVDLDGPLGDDDVDNVDGPGDLPTGEEVFDAITDIDDQVDDPYADPSLLDIEQPVSLTVASINAGGCDDITVQDGEYLLTLVRSANCLALNDGDPIDVVFTIVGRPSITLRAFVMNEGTKHNVPGYGERILEVVDQLRWRRFANTDGFSARDGAGLLSFRGELYLLGGWTHGPVNSEVWRSHDAINWVLLGEAPWPPRHGAGWLVHNDRMWVISGDLYDDVWSSEDGVEWTEETAHAPFGGRYAPSVASVNGNILVFAGSDWVNHVARGFPEVWRSANGRDWTLATATPPWQPRGLIHGTAVWNNEAFLIGGGLKQSAEGQPLQDTVLETNDIWSTADGETWHQRSAGFSFAPRTHFSVLSTPLGCFVSDGSITHQWNVSRELYFAPDCVNYSEIWMPSYVERRHASSFAWWNGRLVLTGGPPGSGTTIWQYFP